MADLPGNLTRTSSGGPLDQIIADYLQQVEAGSVPNRSALLEQHPEHAEQLREFFDDFDRMDQAASPLRLEAAADLTADHQSLDGPAPKRDLSVRYFGDYELIEEIARGGMGIVYKARQTSLNRVVALKMLLKGAFASARDLARFRAEAESIATLDHPHIVPIHEVGEHDGHQYFAMKFIDGRPLGQQPRADLRTEVRRLGSVARAIHYAHQRGILHRDLKPSNILVDVAGVAYVTDFGLAKRLTDMDRSLTETGQLIGTPRYMAPEQAAHRKDLTVAVDVYGLGAILYERLAGRPAFAGDDVLHVLTQVRDAEPPPLTASSGGVDKDLATIARKCLEKNPAHRYATAEALADDLDHWLRGEPITARPVSQLERFRRWCRRNPAVAALSGLVAALLVLGIVVSSGFAITATRRAKQEEVARRQAQASERAAESARQQLELTLARSLVTPLDPDLSHLGVLSVPEVDALGELATINDDRLATRFFETATADPRLLPRLLARAEPATIAALGLSANRRDFLSERLLISMRDPRAPQPQRANLAFLILEWQAGDGAVAREAAETIQRALASYPSTEQRGAWMSQILNNADHWPPQSTAELLTALLARGIASERPLRTGSLSEPMRPGFPIEPDEVSQVVELFRRILSRLEPAIANELCERAANGILDRASVDSILSLTQRLPDDQAAPLLLKVLGRSGLEPGSAKEVGDVLTGMIQRMPPAHGRSLSADVVSQFLEALKASEHGLFGSLSLTTLETLSKTMEPEKLVELKHRLADLTLESMDRFATAKSTEAVLRVDLLGRAAILMNFCQTSDSSETPSRFVAATEKLVEHTKYIGIEPPVDLFDKRQDTSVVQPAFVELLRRIPRERLDEHAQSWLKWLARSDELNQQGFARDALLATGNLLSAERAREAIKALETLYDHEDATNKRTWWLGGIAVLAHQTDQPELLSTAGLRLVKLLESAEAETEAIEGVKALSRMAAWLPLAEASIAVRTLAAAMVRLDPDGDTLADCISGELMNYKPEEAARSARLLVATISAETDRDRRFWLAAALAVLAPRLSPEQAQAVPLDAVKAMAEALERSDSSSGTFTSGIEVLIGQASTETLISIATLLDDELKVTRDTAKRGTILSLYSPAVKRLPSQERERFHAKNAEVYKNTLISLENCEDILKQLLIFRESFTIQQTLGFLEQVIEIQGGAARFPSYLENPDHGGWIALCKTLPVGTGPSMATPLVRALARTIRERPEETDTVHVEILSALLDQVTKDEASSIRAEVIEHVLQSRLSLSASSANLALRLQLEGVLAAMVEHADREVGSRAVARLVGAMCGESDLNGPDGGTARVGMLARLLGLTHGEKPAGVEAAPKPPSAADIRLTSAELTDLLRKPTCYGAGRRAVLDALGTLHGRRFNNHWDLLQVIGDNKEM